MWKKLMELLGMGGSKSATMDTPMTDVADTPVATPAPAVEPEVETGMPVTETPVVPETTPAEEEVTETVCETCGKEACECDTGTKKTCESCGKESCECNVSA